jgi:hypothetical protein
LVEEELALRRLFFGAGNKRLGPQRVTMQLVWNYIYSTKLSLSTLVLLCCVVVVVGLPRFGLCHYRRGNMYKSVG